MIVLSYFKDTSMVGYGKVYTPGGEGCVRRKLELLDRTQKG